MDESAFKSSIKLIIDRELHGRVLKSIFNIHLDATLHVTSWSYCERIHLA